MQTFHDEKSILQHLQTIFNDPHLCDITFVIGNEKLPASRSHLATQSHVFRSMLYGQMREGSSSEIIISDPHVLPSAFVSLVKYLYSGVIDLGPRNVLHILYVSKLYDIMSLVNKCREIVKGKISESDVLCVWDSALALGEEEIEKKCEDLFSVNTAEIIKETPVKGLSKEVMLKVVSCDNLNIEEIDLFNFVNAWRLQLPEEGMMEHINQIVTHIRFPLITPRHLTEYVDPTKLVDPEVLLEAFKYQAYPEAFDKSKRQFQKRKKSPCQQQLVFVGYSTWNQVQEIVDLQDKKMNTAATSCFPGSHAATWNEYIGKSITLLPEVNNSSYYITFTGSPPTCKQVGCIVRIDPNEPFDGIPRLHNCAHSGKRGIICVKPS